MCVYSYIQGDVYNVFTLLKGRPHHAGNGTCITPSVITQTPRVWLIVLQDLCAQEYTLVHVEITPSLQWPHMIHVIGELKSHRNSKFVSMWKYIYTHLTGRSHHACNDPMWSVCDHFCGGPARVMGEQMLPSRWSDGGRSHGGEEQHKCKLPQLGDTTQIALLLF